MQPSVTRELISTQLENVKTLASEYGWKITTNLDELAIEVRMQSPVDDEEYIVHLNCDDYDARPPYVDMVDPITGEIGAPNAYFDDRGSDGNFLIAYPEPDEPVLCHRFNRRIYEKSGIHDNWNNMAGWKSEAGNLTNLGDILLYIYSRLQSPHYDGRYEVS